MCNLYRLTKDLKGAAEAFRVENAMQGANFGEYVFPGQPGAVIESGRLLQMTWGFPLTLKGKSGQPLKPKPVNNARTDKLDGNFWRASFVNRRCLIPLTAWAEAEGAKGAKTRTWLSRPDAEVFAVAGVWRDSAEWGKVYSMIMTDAAGEAARVHDRMPVLLGEDQQATWTTGEPDDAFELCRAWEGELTIAATDEPWAGRR